MPGKRLQQLRSLEYHRAVADLLRERPELLDVARERVQRWREGGQLHPRYADAWDRVLAQPFDEILEFLAAETDEAVTLRHVSPFAAFLDYRERLRIWREAKAQLEP